MAPGSESSARARFSGRAAGTALESSSPGASDDSELAARVAAGDTRARRELVQRLGARVRAIAGTILRNRADTEDAVQATWVAIFTSISSYRGGNLAAWVARISGRTAMRHARKRSERAARTDAGSDWEQFTLGEPPLSFPGHASPRPLLAYLEELPEPRQLVLVLRHVLDYSVEEIAALTETSVNTVKDRLLSARRELRRAIRRDLALAPLPVKGNARRATRVPESLPPRRRSSALRESQ
jgi:RNA polymerase sigma-70 factor (ECF subfamily)